jgi:hypothetical protein
VINITAQGADQGSQAVEDTTTDTPDTNFQFRVLDCMYIYNLGTDTLFGAGVYHVEVLLNGNLPIDNIATFTLR